MEFEGYRVFKANELPQSEQKRLRQTLRHELTEFLVRAIKSSPPEIDLAEIELILRPGQEISDWNEAADCITCITCITCDTCSTS